MEICEIRVVARLFFDFFVLFSNLRNSNRKSLTNYWHNQSDVILFFPSWKIHQQIKDDCRRQNEERNWFLSQEYHLKQSKSLVDFELDGADTLYLPHALWYLPMNSVTSLESRRGNLKKKYRISAIYQPAEQNLLHVGDIFKDTVDLRECPSEYSLNGLFGMQPN